MTINANKKNVLFVVTSFSTGGITSSLRNFLNCYDVDKLNVEVFALSSAGILKKSFQNCNVLPINREIDALYSRRDKYKGAKRCYSFVIKLIDKISSGNFRNYLFKKHGKKLVKQHNYDAVIGFSEGAPTFFVSLMNHHNKICWIHCDYKSYFDIVGHKREEWSYDKMASIVCVSKFTQESFLSIYPQYRRQTTFIYNILDVDIILSLSANKTREQIDSSLFNIVSVGRLDFIKRLSIIPQVAYEIVKAGCKFRWYIIGPQSGTPDEYNKLIDGIEKYHVSNYVKYLGEQTNPYSYIRNADILVSTSVSEACPYVVKEALLLKTPVVSTIYGSISEFIDYGLNGYYEELNDLPQRIISLIKNPDELNRLKLNISKDNENEAILEQIYSLIENKN